jgi:hypothetical protein
MAPNACPAAGKSKDFSSKRGAAAPWPRFGSAEAGLRFAPAAELR